MVRRVPAGKEAAPAAQKSSFSPSKCAPAVQSRAPFLVCTPGRHRRQKHRLLQLPWRPAPQVSMVRTKGSLMCPTASLHRPPGTVPSEKGAIPQGGRLRGDPTALEWQITGMENRAVVSRGRRGGVTGGTFVATEMSPLLHACQ